jgi:hypothetical protein
MGHHLLENVFCVLEQLVCMSVATYESLLKLPHRSQRPGILWLSCPPPGARVVDLATRTRSTRQQGIICHCKELEGRLRDTSAPIDPENSSKVDTLTSAALLSETEVKQRLEKAAGLFSTAHLLAPFDRESFNAALLVW